MILDRLREELSETTIKTWFDETTVVALEGDELILHCPNAFKRTNIQEVSLPVFYPEFTGLAGTDGIHEIVDKFGD